MQIFLINIYKGLGFENIGLEQKPSVWILIKKKNNNNGVKGYIWGTLIHALPVVMVKDPQ